MDQKETTKPVKKYRIGFAIFEVICTAIILTAISYSAVAQYFGYHTDTLAIIKAYGMPINSAVVLNSYLRDVDLSVAIVCIIMAICCLNIIFKLIYIFNHKLRSAWLSTIVMILGIAASIGIIAAMGEAKSEAKGELLFFFGEITIEFGSGGLWLLAGSVLLFLEQLVVLTDSDVPASKKASESKEEPQEEKVDEPIPADTHQEVNKEEEKIKVQEATAPIAAEPKKKNRKLPFIIGGLVGIGLLATLAFFVFGGNKKGNDLLHVQKPAWDKFVMLTQDEVVYYKEPSFDSPQLECMKEDVETDNYIFYYKWSDTPTKAGFTSSPCWSYANEILPMIEKVGDWYKVVFYSSIGSIECYLPKAQCQEITPEPITQGLLKNLTAYYYDPATFGLQTEGKYKNFCFISVNSDMESPWLSFAILYDGVLVNPRTKRISTQLVPEVENTFELGEYYGENTLLYNYLSSTDGMFNAQVLGSDGTSNEADLDRLFNYVTYLPSDEQEVSYYFPTVAVDHIYTFRQHLTEKSPLYEGDD